MIARISYTKKRAKEELQIMNQQLSTQFITDE
jgi:hypothetical protein